MKSDTPPLSSLNRVHHIGDYFLYPGKDLEYCFIENENSAFYLLGSMYDWEKPHFTNQQILEVISHSQTIEDVLRVSAYYCGEFILIVKISGKLYLLNDATAQKEVYYDSTFTCFGTQPKLLGLVTDLLDHDAEDAKTYYNSKIFQKKRLFIGNTTHKKNIFHLLPNHFLDITGKRVQRFFPGEKLKKQSIAVVAQKSARILKGYIDAISKRHKLKMAVTGGYDSRVLFLASLDVECEYYVSKHASMKGSHHDIYIPQRLTRICNKNFKIEEDEKINASLTNVDYSNDIDFPRFLNIKHNPDFTYIVGSISEIARNYFGYHKNATAADLCYLSGNSTSKFAIREYTKWLKNKKIFKQYGYHYLDMFYWEEKMGNWAAKAKTENYALGRDTISPFNSRALLSLLLRTNRKHRDSHFNKLYDLIISELSNGNEEILRLPVNPCRKQNTIRFMKTCGVYNSYRNIGLKLRS